MPAASELPATIPRRSPIAILLIALAWLVAAAAVALVAMRAMDPFAATIPVIATLILTVAAPLAIVLVAVELVRRSGGSAARLAELELRTRQAALATAAIREGLFDVDATLAAIAGRLDALRGAASGDPAGLVASASQIETAAATMVAASGGADAAAKTLMTTLPAAQRQADAVAATLQTTAAETARQLETIETMLAGIWARNVDAREQVELASATTAGLIAGIEAASSSAAATIGERTAGLSASVDAAYDRTTAALDAARDGVHAQTDALLASVDQARVALDQIGGSAAHAIAERLAHAIDASDALGGRLGAHEEQGRAMVASIERSFTVLDARLGHAASMGSTTLDGFGKRVAAVREQVDAITVPLEATGAALRDAEASVFRLTEGTDTAVAHLDSALPSYRDAVAGLTFELASMTSEIGGFEQPVAAARAAVVGAGADFATERGRVETAAVALRADLVTAQATLGTIEETAHGSALAAATALIEVLSRVREVANATAGQMRQTLAGVVAEAEEALDAAGTTRAAKAFGDPIRAEIAGLEGATDLAGAAAKGVADRIAARLLGLTATVATVEARVGAADARFDQRLRDDIAKRSATLLEALQASAIDVVRPMALDVTSTDWAAYLAGDRGRFARRGVRLIDGGTSRAIARHYREDPVFAEQASRYIADFEALLDVVRGDRAGQAMAVTLVSSDVGKLYVLLCQALERVN